jgi:hypothetical protein
MCHQSPALTIDSILKDSLVRLVMASDGVDETELRNVLEKARRAVARRSATRGQRAARPPIVPPKRTADARLQPALMTW